MFTLEVVCVLPQFIYYKGSWACMMFVPFFVNGFAFSLSLSHTHTHTE